MAWEVDPMKSDFDAKSFIDQQIGGREGLRTGASARSTSSGGGFFGFGAYSIVGMDCNKIPAVREKIRNYINTIEQHLNGIDARADASNAYQDEGIQQAVKAYVEKMKEYCINLITKLAAFSDKLKDAQDKWEANAAAMKAEIEAKAASFDAGTRYQETK